MGVEGRDERRDRVGEVGEIGFGPDGGSGGDGRGGTVLPGPWPPVDGEADLDAGLGAGREVPVDPSVPAQREGGSGSGGPMAQEPSSDSTLVQRMRDGDDRAFGELYRRHSEAVRRYARTCCRDAHTADDLTAEVFARTLQAVRRGAGPEHAVRAYLLTTVRRVAAAWTRTAKREHLVDDFALFAAQSARSAEVSDDDTLDLGADVRAMHEAEQTLAVQAFRSLPERWQAVLWHTTVEEESPSEVAPLFGLTANATAVLASRAREGLKQAYLQAHVSAALLAGGDCAQYADRLGAYARGGLRVRAERGLRKHLEECAKCRVAAGELSDVNAGIPALLPVAVIGWFAGGYAVKAAGLVAGGAAGAAGAGAAAASGAGSSSAGGAAGAVGGEALGAPAKAAIAAAVAVAVAAGVVFALAGDETKPPVPKPMVEAPASQPASQPAVPPEPVAEPPVRSERAPEPVPERVVAARVVAPSPAPEPPDAPSASPSPSPSASPAEPRPGPAPEAPAPPSPRPPEPAEPAPAPPVPVVYRVNQLAYDVLGDRTAPEVRLGGSGALWRRDGMSIGGVAYPYGVTMHTKSSVTIDLPPACTRFDALVGIDDLTLGLGAARFSLYGDEALLWQSRVIRGGERAVGVSVDISGRESIRLVVEPGRSAGAAGVTAGAVADWARARISCAG